MRVLVSGFEPFGGDQINPSEKLIEKLLERKFSFTISGVVLPVSFQRSFTLLKKHIDESKPDFVICTGLAKNRAGITIERTAVNIMDSISPDNDGFKPTDERILQNEEDGLFSNLPIRLMLKELEEAKIKSSISNTAGTYVCNHLMYNVISYGKKIGYKGGFIHLPPTPDMSGCGDNTMSLSEITDGITQICKALEKEFYSS